MKYLSWYADRPYTPVIPQADNERIADKGDRLVLYHQLGAEPKFIIAPRGTLQAGWVVGVFK